MKNSKKKYNVSDPSIYCSTLESLETDEDVLSPAGRLVLDYEDQYDWHDGGAGDTGPVWVWVSMGAWTADNIPQHWLQSDNTSVG